MILFYLWQVRHAFGTYGDSNDILNTVKALINAGADVNYTNDDGETVLDFGNL
jgi:hypothetical protein